MAIEGTLIRASIAIFSSPSRETFRADFEGDFIVGARASCSMGSFLDPALQAVATRPAKKSKPAMDFEIMLDPCYHRRDVGPQ